MTEPLQCASHVISPDSAKHLSLPSQRAYANLLELLENTFRAVVSDPYSNQNMCGGLILFNTPWFFCERKVGMHELFNAIQFHLFSKHLLSSYCAPGAV